MGANGCQYPGWVPFAYGNEPVYGGGLTIDLPLFDGFARSKKRRMAESELEAAQNELAASRDAATREVWKAYTDFTTSSAQTGVCRQAAFGGGKRIRGFPRRLSSRPRHLCRRG